MNTQAASAVSVRRDFCINGTLLSSAPKRVISSAPYSPETTSELWPLVTEGIVCNLLEGLRAMAELTHFDAKGDAHMVDVGAKAQTKRIARARGEIHMAPATFALCAAGTAKKGDVIGVARIAAIMASKRTSELIPLCHPIALTHVSVDFELDEAKSKVVCIAQCECSGQTGVEMEALTAVQVGLLTVYDMLKAVDRGMVMTEICLLEKDGGKSGHWLRS